MKNPMPVILIGPNCDDPAESVSAVNRTLAEGLGGRFTFVCSASNRRYGLTRQSTVNFWNLFYLVKHLAIWMKNLLRHRPDVAHYAVSSGSAMEKAFLMFGVARLFGARTVGHLHSGSFLEHWKKLSPSRRRFAYAQLAKLDAFIVLSEQWRERIAEQVGIAREKIHVVNNPIDPAFEDQALCFPVVRQELAILSMGTMGRDKGVFELVEACGILRRLGHDFHLRIVGPEREPGIRATVEQKIVDESCSNSILLCGATFGADRVALFRESSIFVLPSHYENFPLVVLEAAAAGQAIVTTPVGAIPEFFKHDVSAVFVPVKDVSALAKAIEHLVLHPAESHELGQEARRAFQGHLKRDRILSSLEAAYAAILTPLATPSVAGSDFPTPTNPTIP